jgi:hypothetical protein
MVRNVKTMHQFLILIQLHFREHNHHTTTDVSLLPVTDEPAAYCLSWPSLHRCICVGSITQTEPFYPIHARRIARPRQQTPCPPVLNSAAVK